MSGQAQRAPAARVVVASPHTARKRFSHLLLDALWSGTKDTIYSVASRP
jgi:hypothetical protein